MSPCFFQESASGRQFPEISLQTHSRRDSPLSCSSAFSSSNPAISSPEKYLFGENPEAPSSTACFRTISDSFSLRPYFTSYSFRLEIILMRYKSFARPCPKAVLIRVRSRSLIVVRSSFFLVFSDYRSSYIDRIYSLLRLSVDQ